MASLPQVSRRNPTTEAPRSTVSAADVARPYQAMAQGIAKVGAGLEAFEAEYTKTVESGALATGTTDLESGFDNAARENIENPDGFKKWAEGYKSSIIEKAPTARIRQQLAAHADRLTVAGESRIRDGQFKRQLQTAENALEARRETATERAAGLARAGQAGSEEYKALTAEISSINNERVRSPLSTYSQEQADRDTKRSLDTLTIEGVYGSVERAWDSTPGDPNQKYAALSKQLSETLANPDLAFDSADRRRFEAQGQALLRSKKVEAQADAGALRGEASVSLQALQADPDLADDPSYDELGGRLRAAGLHREALQLERVRSGAKILGPYMAASGEEREAIRRGVAQSKAERAERQPIASGGRSRADAVNKRAETAMAFFTSKGLSKEQAAGVVGNLIQESSLHTAARNRGDGADGSDSIGIGQWNGTRAAALKQFAATRGKPADDFETQMEFVLHELDGSESATGQRLRSAKTAEEAAAAFIGYERPQGWTPENPRGGHGWNNRASHAARLAGVEINPSALAALPKEAREQFKKDATESVRSTFTSVKQGVAQGILPSEETVTSMVEQFPLLTDRALVDEITQTLETAGVAAKATAADRPIGEQQAAVGALRGQLAENGADPVEIEMLGVAEKMLDENERVLKEDPLSLWDRTRSQTRSAERLGPLSWGDPEALGAEMQKRTVAATFVGTMHDKIDVPVLRPNEASAAGNIIARGTADEASTVLASLAGLPEEAMVPTIALAPVKEAIAGAVRSNDPGKFTAAMTYVDQMWAKAPQDVAKELGEDTVKALQDWQAMIRYYSPEEMTTYLKGRNDPQVMERRKRVENEGEAIARKKPDAEIMDGFDPGIFASEPGAPLDPGTRDMLRSDYERVFGERYASSRDQTVAHKQTMERLRMVWSPSELNGGRLTMFAPEVAYKPSGGSYDWMRDQLEIDLRGRLGLSLPASRAAAGDEQPDRPLPAYSVIADRRTEADISIGRPASYQIATMDPDTGRVDVLRDQTGREFRYSWDQKQVREDAAAQFAEQRARVLKEQTAPKRGTLLPAYRASYGGR
jgi:hypothetical protein